MSSLATCPICRSSDVGEHAYEGGLVMWFVCRQCAHVWVLGPSASSHSDLATQTGLALSTTVDARPRGNRPESLTDGADRTPPAPCEPGCEE
jgi:hypothetical protein